jgi:lauroyl/myristoyl acyltransferase
MQMVEQLPYISSAWLRRHIRVAEDGALLEEIAETGAVILSHHSYHHNLLISYFKVCGLASFPVGNPPTAFSDDDYLYHFTVRLNDATATNLNNGRWLFNNQGKDFLRGLKRALEPGNILLVFCDFNEAKKSNPVLPFLGKTLQIPNGVLRLVEKETVPVYFAGFHREPPGSYLLSLRRLRTQGADPETAPLGEQYLAALEQHVRQHPAAWQCWEAL